MKNDFFANIAAAGIQSRREGLIEPAPEGNSGVILETGGTEAAFLPTHKMSGREELYEEVLRQREYYLPFLKDHAPQLRDLRRYISLTEFEWRIGTAEDKLNFEGVLSGKGEWDKVHIPHYGEPRGVAVTYYRTEYMLGKQDLEKGSAWITFQGVDYKAHVFMNGCYLGSHEGFFAPFEFEFTQCAREGINTLVVMVENDYIHMGNCSEYKGAMHTGDKFYAATGPGYDEPMEGWHHCPPGMGIYQNVRVEIRSSLFVRDIFVRTLPKERQAELWLELYSCDIGPKQIVIEYSVYGQNFRETVIEGEKVTPSTYLEVGVGDTLTEAKVKAEGRFHKEIPMPAERGINYYKIPFEIKNPKIWDLKTPWLYQCQVRVTDKEGNVYDQQKRQFGVRSFRMDTDCEPKGKLYLNGRQIRLRGANTMGHEQQCVMHEDWEQLLTDLLLAKVCNMNFLRLTQRPVQPEVYELCDRLGLMIQTDLPLFAALRRNQFVEGLKQVQEMEHLIRSHPCCVLVSYINEPMPNAHNKPHRNLVRKELEDFFRAADICLKIVNPDRVVKHIDGDYEPPTDGYPDNHCYPCWYNGHGIDIGKLHKGYWMWVREGWYYGCGEFGIEALEEVGVMEKYYPRDWLPETGKESDWTPAQLPGAQTGGFHYFFYDTRHSLEEWVRASQRHQADSISLMTQAFRRDRRMNSFAYHLFIDAFPEGWMKTIMDVDRNPKEGFFAYRDALTPLMVNLRSDRNKVYAGETIGIEAWVCNDLDEEIKDTTLHYQIELQGKVLSAGKRKAVVPACSSQIQGLVQFHAPSVEKRTVYALRLGLADKDGKVLHDHSLEVEVFPKVNVSGIRAAALGGKEEIVKETLSDMGWEMIPLQDVKAGDCIFVFSYEEYTGCSQTVMEKVNNGARVLFQELPAGDYAIGNTGVHIQNCGMLPLHFASRDTGHELVRGLREDDIKYWYDPETGYITPLLERTIDAPEYRLAAASGNQDSDGNWHRSGALVSRQEGAGQVYISELKMFGRTGANPIARLLLSGIAGREVIYD